MKTNFLRTLLILPLLFFLILCWFFYRGLSIDPHIIPTYFKNKEAPNFNLPSLLNPQHKLSKRDFGRRWVLLNVWSTWCLSCQDEHAFLVKLSQDFPNINIIGLDYKDNATKAKTWLKENGNPYHAIASDKDGKVALRFGVYGTPETFIIDPKGVIRDKIIGPVTAEVWNSRILPTIKKYA